jgi:Asp-tRNA(Asn)/Glu-tRNA(Gln) amidotransferase A subunit family amidase
VEHVRDVLERLAADRHNAVVTLDAERALATAEERAAELARHEWRGPLHGVAVGVKDLFDVVGLPTRAGSAVLADAPAATTEGPVVARLREAGAVIVGKLATHEFAYGPTGDVSATGPARNPHDPTRITGGSSSGSAAAVAAEMVPLAIGSQTNGSVIRPAAFCGVIGVKPTHGTISRHGAMLLSRALDHVGTFAGSLADSALLLEVLAGYDPHDPDTRPVAAPNFRAMAAEDPEAPPRLAFVRTPVWDKADAGTHAAFEALTAELGDDVEEAALPDDFAGAWDDHRVVMATDMAHNLGAMVARGGEAKSSEALRAILSEGAETSAVRYLAARDKALRYRAGIAALLAN